MKEFDVTEQEEKTFQNLLQLTLQSEREAGEYKGIVGVLLLYCVHNPKEGVYTIDEEVVNSIKKKIEQ